MTGIGEQFECANCHGTFTKTWDDEEALAETAAMWKPVPGDDLAIICDDCFQEISSWARTEAPDTLTEAAYLASLPQRMAEVEHIINAGLADVLPEGMRFEWGISEDEIAAEAATFEASRAEFIDQVMRWPYYLRHPRRAPHVRVELPAACYRSEYGFMVHVRDACRCA